MHGPRTEAPSEEAPPDDQDEAEKVTAGEDAGGLKATVDTAVARTRNHRTD